MSKLDEQGILTLSAIQNVLDSCVGNGFTMESYYLAVASAERDALLELFLEWVDEADSINKRHHYGDGGQEGIAFLYAQLAKLRGMEKPPG